MSITEQLSRFVVETRFEDMPPEGVHLTKKLNLDCLGVALAGSADPAGRTIRKILHAGPPEAGVINSGFRTAAADAAFANGTMAHALDYDDFGFPAASNPGHPTVTMMPVLLALGEKHRLPGRLLVEAYLVGLEVWARVAPACSPGHIRGWHPTAIFGNLAAASVGARLLKLDTDQTRAALGIAASLTGGLLGNFGTNAKPMHAGAAARNGIIAAQLAKEGFSANPEILDDPSGFGLAFFGEGGFHREQVTSDLGKVYRFTTSTLNIKKYPACGAVECPLDALLTLLKEPGVGYERIERIRMDCSPFVPKVMSHHHPKTGPEAKFSLEYCLGAAALDGRLTLSSFDPAKVTSPELQEAMSKVQISPVSDWPADLPMAVNVTIFLKDGRSFSKRVDRPRGSRELPLTEDELLTKYRDCAGVVLSKPEIERTIDLVMDLEKLPDITDLARIITK